MGKWKLYSIYQSHFSLFIDFSAKENKTNEENRRMIYEAVPENAIESESKDKSNIISNSNSQER